MTLTGGRSNGWHPEQQPIVARLPAHRFKRQLDRKSLTDLPVYIIRNMLRFGCGQKLLYPAPGLLDEIWPTGLVPIFRTISITQIRVHIIPLHQGHSLIVPQKVTGPIQTHIPHCL